MTTAQFIIVMILLVTLFYWADRKLWGLQKQLSELRKEVITVKQMVTDHVNDQQAHLITATEVTSSK